MRARFAEHVREVIGASSDAGVIIAGARALITIGHRDESTASSVRGIMLDHVVPPNLRAEAATILATIDPRDMAEAVDVVLRTAPFSRHLKLLDLARLGADVAAHATAELDGDADCDTKLKTAELVVDLHGQPDRKVLRDLRDLADDTYLASSKRREALMTLARFEPSASAAIGYLDSVVLDRDAPVEERGDAAHVLVRLDRSQWLKCVATLKRALVDPAVTLEEQVTLIGRLRRLNALRQGEINKLNLAVVHHPGSPTPVRRDALRRVTDQAREAILQGLVSDTSTPVAVRLPRYADDSLTEVVTVAAREVLTAIESTPADRATAAVALTRSSRRSVPEAVGTLTGLAVDHRFRAWRALADCGTPHRREVVTAVLDVVGDQAQPRHARFRAVELVTDLLRTPPAEVVDFLHEMASGETSARRRLDALFRLRHVDEVDAVRAMRDDERVPASVRRLAATKLADYRPEDRAKGAGLLRAIAADTGQRPALRCAAASDLLRFGAAGRAHAAEIAHVMAVDTELPPTSRVRAAEVLAVAARSRRGEALAILDELCGAKNPLHRLHAVNAVAAMTPLRATHTLRAMTTNRDLPPVVRLRCAEALVRNHREHREPAVITAREVAFDEQVPKHVRVHAARNLARWSEVFRDEARRLLHDLLER
ncbi:MAG: hypothetical protein HOQ46_24010 [Saccharothrix sp.]|nr:hypothetical protein [Saccharothrix sp.]